MQKRLIGEARCQAGQMRYYLLEETMEDGESYGVGIELKEEGAWIPDLSPSRQRVRELAEALVKGTVTPVGLRDVVEDWLLE